MVIIPEYYMTTLKKGKEEVAIPVKKDEVIDYCTKIPDGVGARGGPFIPTENELLEGFTCSYFDTIVSFSPIDSPPSEIEL